MPENLVHFCSFLFIMELNRVSVQGAKSLGCHFACLCWGFDYHEVKKWYYFSKRKATVFTLLIIFTVKSLQKE